MAGDRSVSVGGSVSRSAIVTGDGSIAAAGGSDASIRAVDVQDEIASIRALLAAAGCTPDALSKLDEAGREAQAPAPDKHRIAGLIAGATGYAKLTSGLADQSQQLVSHLHQLAGWLGQAWSDLPPMLGR